MSMSVTRPVITSRLPKPTLPPAVPSSVKVATCCGRSAPSTAPTASAACACRCTVAVSCALPVVPGAIWKRRGRSGGRSSSARRPSGGLQPASSACHAVDSRHRTSQATRGSRQEASADPPAPRAAVSSAARPGPAARRVPGRPAGEPRRHLPAAAGHSPGPGAAVGRGLCGAGHLAACRPRLARWPRGLSAYDAGGSPREPLRPCGGDRRAGPQGQAPRSSPWREGVFQRHALQAGPGRCGCARGL